ncbi:hypothetical protein ACU8KH_05761 [Lachancea thermotolerans]
MAVLTLNPRVKKGLELPKGAFRNPAPVWGNSLLKLVRRSENMLETSLLFPEPICSPFATTREDPSIREILKFAVL